MRNVTEIDISVIVPIFNGKKWINRCIESVECKRSIARTFFY